MLLDCIPFQIVFSFNAGTGAALMRSERPYNNGQWHSAQVERSEEYGILSIDGFPVANGTGKGESNHIDLQVRKYIFLYIVSELFKMNLFTVALSLTKVQISTMWKACI